MACNYGAADEVILMDGDVIHGRIIKQTDLGIVLDHNDLGRLEIGKERIKSVTVVVREIEKSEEAPKKTTIETQPSPEPEMSEKSNFLERSISRTNARISHLKKKGYSFSMDFGFDGSYGNTDEQSIRIGMNIKRKLEKKRWESDLSYYNKIAEGDQSDNKLTTGYTYDWLKPESPLFYFATARYDYDEFESWEQRVAGHVGPGYHLIQKEEVSFDIRLGAGARKEWGSENDDWRPEGLAGLGCDWKITKRQRLDLTSTIYPVFSDWEDFRTRTAMNWRFLLGEESKLSLLLGLAHEYQSIVDPTKKKNDTRLFSALQYSF
jgi:putative salt-induced outer membrane protein YdiY